MVHRDRWRAKNDNGSWAAAMENIVIWSNLSRLSSYMVASPTPIFRVLGLNPGNRSLDIRFTEVFTTSE